MAKVSLTATLEHGEAKLDYLKVAWRNFLNGLPTLGFNVESEYVAEGVEIRLGQFWSGTTAEAAITSGLLEPDANEPPKTLKDVKAGINALKSGIGGNRVLPIPLFKALMPAFTSFREPGPEPARDG